MSLLWPEILISETVFGIPIFHIILFKVADLLNLEQSRPTKQFPTRYPDNQ